MSCLRQNVAHSTLSSGASRRVVSAPRPLSRPLAQRQRCRPANAFRKEDDTLPSGFRTLTQRYDFLSSGLGAMCVTTFFVMRGQEPAQALTVTAVSSILALVLNELLFNPPSK
ncbi:hypothetical protein DUNSADRAFT_7240 [Dunaliella salina]|uniref:Uncharacterized protein n=1 Tax=Dunaliella salina TaxID=3046 RepID=A0ABQ7GLQ3_DUNSA|nr:hypothetical protein DUNSADRAFT_7240 [Dunaliella salina]|eukprot:KAF5835541.1 hypothetical protein DUNSADRAFT_7240 [Dunaliella salina]